jgi:hypothetical protein
MSTLNFGHAIYPEVQNLFAYQLSKTTMTSVWELKPVQNVQAYMIYTATELQQSPT